MTKTKKYQVSHIIQERTGRKNPVWHNIYSSRQSEMLGRKTPTYMTKKQFHKISPKYGEYETKTTSRNQIILTTTDAYDRGKKKRRSIFTLENGKA